MSESELEMGYVGKHGVEALQRYKYSGVDKSYMAKYVFQPFWRYCVNFFPLWMPYVFFVSRLLPAPPCLPPKPNFPFTLSDSASYSSSSLCGVLMCCCVLSDFGLNAASLSGKKGSGTRSLIWRI